MLKMGIYRVEDIGLPTNREEAFFGGRKNVSITLYEEACLQENADDLTQRILLLFSDERGAYKRTYAKRFEDFDKEAVGILKRHFSGPTLDIHDAGVSDGRTSVDLFRQLSIEFPELTFTASDYDPNIKILEKGKLKVVLSNSEKVLEITRPPFVFNTIKRDRYCYYPLNHFFRKILEWFRVKPLVALYKNHKIAPKTLFLFAPSAIKLARETTNFQLAQHDLLKPFVKQYDVIRAMNVLNPSYFSEQEFPLIIKNIHDALKVNGIFVTGSNQGANTLVDGGLYQKTLKGFDSLWHSGKGSPIRSYIANTLTV